MIATARVDRATADAGVVAEAEAVSAAANRRPFH